MRKLLSLFIIPLFMLLIGTRDVNAQRRDWTVRLTVDGSEFVLDEFTVDDNVQTIKLLWPEGGSSYVKFEEIKSIVLTDCSEDKSYHGQKCPGVINLKNGRALKNINLIIRGLHGRREGADYSISFWTFGRIPRLSKVVFVRSY